ncbi:hypothetical protein RHSIM_Rhsim12G0143300 [Rhododendron simsii]|uniref:LOB domain-containing protein n=1 Tax=Rhododendron simsii TaxID=118357 RepID=A0A834G880_RHOSS|nr:hypothetical protein RHSIM_Rhsim12G0143300 [Rhododendron simsii]
MRVSCNGCRVLRKGCSDDCPIRPCLQWIKSPESQSNATVFLAKFYGRAGLQNLINAGPDHLRPSIFRSLLYEACGRIVNPIYGSAGLLWSGNWHLCHAAVEAVLAGAPIVQVSLETDESTMSPPLKACDIRHVSKDESSAASRDVHHKVRTRGKFKRAGKKPKGGAEPAVDEAEAARVMWSWSNKKEFDRSASHDSVVSHQRSEGDSRSVETVEDSLAKADEGAGGRGVELELSLGLEPILRAEKALKRGEEIDGSSGATCEVQLGLNFLVGV